MGASYFGTAPKRTFRIRQEGPRICTITPDRRECAESRGRPVWAGRSARSFRSQGAWNSEKYEFVEDTHVIGATPSLLPGS